jgi:hypothetical protein
MKPLIGCGSGVNASVRTTCQRQDVHSDGKSPTHRSARSWANSRETGFEETDVKVSPRKVNFTQCDFGQVRFDAKRIPRLVSSGFRGSTSPMALSECAVFQPEIKKPGR